MTTNGFAHHIGLAKGENLYQIKRGHNRISKRLAETIVEAFPDINILWLLYGKGGMFTSEALRNRDISYYEEDVEIAIRHIDDMEPHSTMTFPSRVEADFAMFYMGNAMGESIPPNTMVALKRVEREQMVPGKEYVVVTPHLAALRIVRTEANDPKFERVRLAAVNEAQYDDIVVERGSIEAVYRVVAKLIINY